jgi:epoxyqueuosine reductase
MTLKGEYIHKSVLHFLLNDFKRTFIDAIVVDHLFLKAALRMRAYGQRGAQKSAAEGYMPLRTTPGSVGDPVRSNQEGGMTALVEAEIGERIIEKAKALGASLAGVADVAQLKQSPSHLVYPNIECNSGAGADGTADDAASGGVFWPEGFKSAVVIALEHSEEQPELDWWHGKRSPPGNRILMRISAALSKWVVQTLGLSTHRLPYHIDRGGIFLKDAAVLAGLGCIGKNNLLVTPEFGPRIRLRAMLIDVAIATTGPIAYDPCGLCDQPCRRACPQGAFDDTPMSSDQMGLTALPGRDGSFSRSVCNIQMVEDIDAAGQGINPRSGHMEKIVKHCRRCELACPVGA